MKNIGDAIVQWENILSLFLDNCDYIIITRNKNSGSIPGGVTLQFFDFIFIIIKDIK